MPQSDRTRTAFEDPDALDVLLRTVPDGVAVVEDGRFSFVSEALGRMLGTSADRLVGRPPVDLVHPDDRDLARNVVGRGLERSNGASHPPCLSRIRHEDGSWIPVEIHSNRIVDRDGPVIVALFRDLRETTRLEEQLRRAQTLEAIGEVTGSVAHDFNNLLTAILAPVELAIDVLGSESEVSQELDDARSSARRAIDLTRQLLAFSRKAEARPTVVDVGEQLERLAPLLRRLVGSRIELELSCEAERPRVRIDTTQLEQIVVNLVINARDEMPEGGTVKVRTRRIAADSDDLRRRDGPPPGPHVVVEVEDEGGGIPEEDRLKVFEPFYTTKKEGTGLGLSTVHGIVTRAEGFVRVRSRVGEGSVFQVFLPEATGPAAVRERSPSLYGDAPRPRSGGPVATERILIVEDEEVILRVMSRALKRQGYDVRSARSGMDAERLLEAEPAFQLDLLITALALPDARGPDLAGKILDDRRGAEVLYTSGYSDDEMLDEIESSGSKVDHLLEKPFSVERLLSKVMEVLSTDEEDPDR